jgi:hypothetical protein
VELELNNRIRKYKGVLFLWTLATVEHGLAGPSVPAKVAQAKWPGPLGPFGQRPKQGAFPHRHAGGFAGRFRPTGGELLGKKGSRT